MVGGDEGIEVCGGEGRRENSKSLSRVSPNPFPRIPSHESVSQNPFPVSLPLISAGLAPTVADIRFLVPALV